MQRGLRAGARSRRQSSAQAHTARLSGHCAHIGTAWRSTGRPRCVHIDMPVQHATQAPRCQMEMLEPCERRGCAGIDARIHVWHLSVGGDQCLASYATATAEMSPTIMKTAVQQRLWLAASAPVTVGVTTGSRRFLLLNVERCSCQAPLPSRILIGPCITDNLFSSFVRSDSRRSEHVSHCWPCRRAVVFSCTLPDTPCLRPPLYPLKAEALGRAAGKSALASVALQPSEQCMVLSRSSVPACEQLPYAQGVRSTQAQSLQNAENAADMRIVPWLLGADRSVQRFLPLPLQVRLLLMRAPMQLLSLHARW